MQAMLERCVEVCDSLLDVKEQLLAYKKSLSTLEGTCRNCCYSSQLAVFT